MCSKTNDCYFDLFKIANNSFQFRDAKVIMESELSRMEMTKCIYQMSLQSWMQFNLVMSALRVNPLFNCSILGQLMSLNCDKQDSKQAR